jgi:ABC-type glycerol-3-phosphate transport system permease component
MVNGTEAGLLNRGLGVAGLGPVEWIQQFPMETIIVVNIWRGLSFAMVLFAASLEGFPQQVLEASLIDGATPWQQLRLAAHAGAAMREDTAVTPPGARRRPAEPPAVRRRSPAKLAAYLVLLALACFTIVPFAWVDGASRLQATFRVVLPLAGPGVAAGGLIGFVGAWNQFLIPLVLISDQEKIPISIGLFRAWVAYTQVDWGFLAALSIVYVIPAIAFYVVARRSLQQSIAGGLAGT